MKAIIQRVLSASVTVEDKVASSVGRGLLVFVAVSPSDTLANVETMANKVLRLKVWDAEDGSRWKRSVLDLEYQVLLVSQFTLLASTKRGYTPEFHKACPPEQANKIYSLLVEKVKGLYIERKGLEPGQGDVKVQEGVFGANMKVELVNDGPVTLEVLAESKQPEALTGKVEKPRERIKGPSASQKQVDADKESEGSVVMPRETS